MIVHLIFHQLAACETKNLGGFETYHDMEMIPLFDRRARFFSKIRLGIQPPTFRNVCANKSANKIMPEVGHAHLDGSLCPTFDTFTKCFKGSHLGDPGSGGALEKYNQPWCIQVCTLENPSVKHGFGISWGISIYGEFQGMASFSGTQNGRVGLPKWPSGNFPKRHELAARFPIRFENPLQDKMYLYIAVDPLVSISELTPWTHHWITTPTACSLIRRCFATVG